MSSTLWRRVRCGDFVALSFAVVGTEQPALGQIRAGRLLGRCHAALGQHALSVAAFEAATQLAKAGGYLVSGSLRP